jgi:metal-responsive CopG/Arc/MetJ family transcriptional regulator
MRKFENIRVQVPMELKEKFNKAARTLGFAYTSEFFRQKMREAIAEADGK